MKSILNKKKEIILLYDSIRTNRELTLLASLGYELNYNYKTGIIIGIRYL